jgi:pimeloyl-ACP methyl ester carboxylesterase
MGRKIWLAIKRVLLGAAILAGIAIAAGVGYRAYRQNRINAVARIDPVRGIDEELFARIGGIEQWISIRGQNRDNPVLLLLHGGPGSPFSIFPRYMFYSWTRDFTVVYWDQRGAGRTYGRSGPLRPGVTFERMAQDGVEVAEFIRTRLHKPKIVLVGVSWGAMLGPAIAHARPDLFYAYLGTGQPVNVGRCLKNSYEQLLVEARRRNNARAVRELEAIGPPPWAVGRQEDVLWNWAQAFEEGVPSFPKAMLIALFDSPDRPSDILDFVSGLQNSGEYFRDQVNALDIPSFGIDFAIPFFVFQGAEDTVTPLAPVREYITAITAPRKELVLIPDAGHSAIFTRSDQFLKLLLGLVRPLTVVPIRTSAMKLNRTCVNRGDPGPTAT